MCCLYIYDHVIWTFLTSCSIHSPANESKSSYQSWFQNSGSSELMKSDLPRGAWCHVCVLAATGKNAAALKSFASLLNMRLTGQHCEPAGLFQFSMIFTGSLKYFQKNRNTLRKATELCWLLANLYDVTWTMLFAFISLTPVMSKLFTCDEMIKFLKPCQRRLLMYKIGM